MKKKTEKTLSLLDKLKKKVTATYKAGTEKKVLVMTITNKELKSKLSTTSGVGFQDLKPTYQALYTHLLVKYKDKVSIMPKSLSPVELEIFIKK